MFDMKDLAPREHPIRNGPVFIPEAQLGGRCDPFLGDVYCLGNMLRAKFLQASVFWIKITHSLISSSFPGSCQLGVSRASD